jgi:hypothetical protein
MTVLEIVQAKLGESGASISPLSLELAVAEVEQAIKNYCSISSVPDALHFTWANMAVDLLRYELASSEGPSEDEEIDVGSVSSIRMGDTTINLGSANSSYGRAINSHKANLDEIVMNYREQLHKFRRMVW